MIRGQLTFSLDTFLVLLEDNNLGEAPMPLGGGERWFPDDELAQRKNNAYTELANLGVFRRGRVDDAFMDTIRVLQRPGIEYYTYAVINGVTITARTSAIGRDAVLMVRSGDSIDLIPGEPEQLPQQLVWSLPDYAPATVHSMSCEYEDYEAAIAGKSVPSGQSGRDAKQIARWVNAEHGDFGELVTAIRAPDGKHQQAQLTPRWIDTERGRILAYLDSTGYLNLVSGTPDKIATRLRQMETELRGR